jgi:hypothetical protein
MKHTREGLLSTPRDREIAEKLFIQFKNEKKTDAGELMVKIGSFFIETPYVARTLETGEEEKMVVNLREMDCTTFAEYCLALTRTIRSGKCYFDRFIRELEHLRYRGGIRNGYPSRLHYFSDWITDNEEKKIVQNITRDLAHTIKPNRVNFMSSHPDNYSVLASNPGILQEISAIENRISERMAWFIPKDQVAKLEHFINDGDIIAFTTYIEGLDVSHVAIAVWVDGRVRFLHASSKLHKVVLSDEKLEEYLNSGRMLSGIMVARPL